MIPSYVKILHGELPDAPGVYFYYNDQGKLLYVGKATSLKKRVGSYFVGNDKHPRTAELVSKIAEIKYTQVPTVIEALVLEANQIRLNKPPYNILGRDDKSFIYLCITNEDFPKPVLMRGLDLERIGIQPFSKNLSAKARRQFLAVYGPYLSSRSLKIALDLIRRSIPWSTCNPPTPSNSPLTKGERAKQYAKPCFDAQIGKCPGVCSGMIDKKSYRRNIKKLMLFFEGKKDALLRQLKREMAAAARKKNYEAAASLRDRVFALEHIQDIGLLMRDEFTYELPEPVVGHINALGRIEAYDIANISGTSNVASMVVFEGGKPSKNEYRKFRIKGFEGANDVGAMEEVMRRRLARLPGTNQEKEAWPLPDLLIIDGGEGQVNRVEQVLREFKVNIPVVGIAKGFDRKQDRLVFDKSNSELRRVTSAFKEVFQKARDEAHRFAGAYHRTLRGKQSGIPQRKRRSTE
ncbi:MAG TPA: GIY-YIG nuclease family protein [bacterium]|nr:GIY-YIG nuclease family protein [bacterium]